MGGVSGVVMAAMAFWYFMIRQKSRQHPQPSAQYYKPYQTDKAQIWPNPSEVAAHEGGRRPNELDAQPVSTHELEGRQQGAR